MRIFDLFYHSDIIELNVKILIHRLQCSTDLDVVFELNSDFMVDQSLEETDREDISLCCIGNKRSWIGEWRLPEEQHSGRLLVFTALVRL